MSLLRWTDTCRPCPAFITRASRELALLGPADARSFPRHLREPGLGRAKTRSQELPQAPLVVAAAQAPGASPAASQGAAAGAQSRRRLWDAGAPGRVLHAAPYARPQHGFERRPQHCNLSAVRRPRVSQLSLCHKPRPDTPGKRKAATRSPAYCHRPSGGAVGPCAALVSRGQPWVPWAAPVASAGHRRL